MSPKKSKLVRTLNDNPQKVRHVPTIAETKLWFRIINREIFDNALGDFEHIEIRRRHGAWGECIGYIEKDKRWCHLSLNHYMISKKHFINVVGHEMVHLYQWTVGHEMNHGQSFFEWKPKFAKFKMVLNESQGHPRS